MVTTDACCLYVLALHLPWPVSCSMSIHQPAMPGPQGRLMQQSGPGRLLLAWHLDRR